MMARVDRGDLYMLLVSHVRYALGRRTGVVQDAQDQLRRYARHLTPEERGVIARDIAEEFALAARRGGTIGDPCDHETWVETLAMMEDATWDYRGTDARR